MPQGRNRPSSFMIWGRKLLNNDQLVLTLLAVFIGAAVGGLAILFVELIDFFQGIMLGKKGAWIAGYLSELPFWHIILAPTLGGLIVGIFLYKFMPGGTPKGPADVIAACEVGGGRMSIKEGMMAVFASALSIGSGASVGREGPAVHMGGSISSWAAEKLGLSRSNSRVLLGCGVAAAVAASFNAPIAGALFAQEVILSHYALKAFAPVVIASIAGTVVSHQTVGNVTAFELAGFEFTSYVQFPAFAGLGILCGLMSVLFVQGIFTVQKQTKALPGPQWYKPAVGGFLVGLIALYYPQVLGVGYEATDAALKGQYALAFLLGLFIFKFAATVISLGFGFSGGVFSPSLVIGAMFGGSFGYAMTILFPEISSGTSAYALVGMASMAAAVLGAPISTTLIVFELTGDYTLTIAVMCGCVCATLVTNQMGKQSFFIEQLKLRGIDLVSNYSSVILRQLTVEQVLNRGGVYVSVDTHLQEVRKKMRHAPNGVVYVVSHDRKLYGMISWDVLPEDIFDRDMDPLLIAADLADTRPPVLQNDDTLEIANSVFEESGHRQVAVVTHDEERSYIGCIDESEVMRAYNQALMQKRQQEQGLS